jgi:hypothetical protein
VLRIFIALKNPSPWSGLNPRPLDVYSYFNLRITTMVVDSAWIWRKMEQVHSKI